mmetsp:Transcript_34806/g.96036  ORF Transcript_34806/g.96036 Transcript_34806/m.96036 type:complete len:258 (-) Transcript_34806:1578-2351(-)
MSAQQNRWRANTCQGGCGGSSRKRPAASLFAFRLVLHAERAVGAFALPPGALRFLALQPFSHLHRGWSRKRHLPRKVWRRSEDHGRDCDGDFLVGSFQRVRPWLHAGQAIPFALLPVCKVGPTSPLDVHPLHHCGARGQRHLPPAAGNRFPAGLCRASRVVWLDRLCGLLGRQRLHHGLRRRAAGDLPLQGGAHPGRRPLQVLLHDRRWLWRSASDVSAGQCFHAVPLGFFCVHTRYERAEPGVGADHAFREARSRR